MKIAIPTADNMLCPHFGHCQQFRIMDIDVANKSIVSSESITPPPHEPGVYPRWLSQMGCDHIIAGGMGGRAINIFRQHGIQVITGAPSGNPEEIVRDFLNGELITGGNLCDDSHKDKPCQHEK